jgi:hypothetical protein
MPVQKIGAPGVFVLRTEEGTEPTSTCGLLTTVLQYLHSFINGFDPQHRKRYSDCRREDVRALCCQMDVNVRIEWTVTVNVVDSHEHSGVQTTDSPNI